MRVRNLILLTVVGIAVQGMLSGQVSYDRLLKSQQESRNWMTYSGGYSSWRYSTLNQVRRENVPNLKVEWVY